MSLVDSIPGSHARSGATPRQVLAVWSAALSAAAIWSLRGGWVALASLLALPALFLGLSAIRPPRLLAGLAGKAARFSDAVAEHLSRIVLGLWYYLIFTPVALLWRTFAEPARGRDGSWREFSTGAGHAFRRPF
ncbi:MAG: hypothetical protein HXY18_01200 [Bryobacteraceae bacterium]|nr:hypothetical protein [Bryobacteraceae bacterium]